MRGSWRGTRLMRCSPPQRALFLYSLTDASHPTPHPSRIRSTPSPQGEGFHNITYNTPLNYNLLVHIYFQCKKAVFEKRQLFCFLSIINFSSKTYQLIISINIIFIKRYFSCFYYIGYYSYLTCRTRIENLGQLGDSRTFIGSIF